MLMCMTYCVMPDITDQSNWNCDGCVTVTIDYYCVIIMTMTWPWWWCHCGVYLLLLLILICIGKYWLSKKIRIDVLTVMKQLLLVLYWYCVWYWLFIIIVYKEIVLLIQWTWWLLMLTCWWWWWPLVVLLLWYYCIYCNYLLQYWWWWYSDIILLMTLCDRCYPDGIRWRWWPCWSVVGGYCWFTLYSHCCCYCGIVAAVTAFPRYLMPVVPSGGGVIAAILRTFTICWKRYSLFCYWRKLLFWWYVGRKYCWSVMTYWVFCTMVCQWYCVIPLYMPSLLMARELLLSIVIDSRYSDEVLLETEHASIEVMLTIVMCDQWLLFDEAIDTAVLYCDNVLLWWYPLIWRKYC